MRAAAVQLTATADRERNLATADRLTRAAAASGAELVVLPEKWALLGTPEETTAGAEPFDGPALSWARAIARELGIDLVAGSIAERVPGQRARLEHVRAHRRPTARCAPIYRKIHMFDVEVARARLPRVRERGARRRDRAVGDRRRRRAGPDDLLRPALPGAVPDPRRARRARDHGAGRVHARDDARPLGAAPARPRDREPGVHDRRQPGRPPRRGLPVRRALDDRRPLGRRARAGAGRARRSSPPSSTSTVRRRSAGRCPRSPTAGRMPTHGRRRYTPDGHRPLRGRQAAHDPRRRGPGVRAPGFPHVPGIGHRRRGGRRLRARLPLLPVQGRGARHAVPRALERHARGDRRDRRPADPGARQAARDRRRSSSSPTATTPS